MRVDLFNLDGWMPAFPSSTGTWQVAGCVMNAIGGAMSQAAEPSPNVSIEEQARRQEAVRYARASVRLEGFVLGMEAEAVNSRYISGELTGEEHGAVIRRLAGLDQGHRKQEKIDG